VAYIMTLTATGENGKAQEEFALMDGYFDHVASCSSCAPNAKTTTVSRDAGSLTYTIGLVDGAPDWTIHGGG
jgi:hypothetical protein